jgi:uncharacterized membrane protein YesL
MSLANLFILGILVANFWSYRQQHDWFIDVLRTIWTIILIGWLMTQLYLWSMLDAMDTPTLRGGLRNAALMVALNPIFSLTMLLVIALIFALSTLLLVPWLLITGSLIACIVTAAVRDRLAVHKTVDRA